MSALVYKTHTEAENYLKTTFKRMNVYIYG